MAILTIALPALFVLTAGGCGSALKQSWHDKFNWRAEAYFDDPQVIKLCDAIEANDLEEMKRLIDAGADVNAKGKGNMTPLLWAYPDNKLERFKLLLEHGADPNVFVESDFNTRNMGIRPGDSITQLAAKSAFPGHLSAVMEHGGDPNLVNTVTGDTLLVTVIRQGGARAKERIKLLLAKGVDVNLKNDNRVPPVIEAVSWFAQFDIALLLLEAGADPNAYIEDQNSKLVHVVLREQSGLERLAPQQQADYANLVQWLKDHGESFEEAQADLDRWRSWAALEPREAKKLQDAEIAARKARQRAAESAEDR